MRRRLVARRRRGSVLVYFAILVFALMGVAALTIDLGLAIVTQRQMRTATDAAALEGLRGRDLGTDPAAADKQRRESARVLLQSVFIDTDSPYDASRNFGAGPLLDFQDGVPIGNTGFNASETYGIGNPPGYQPSDVRWPFQTNGWDEESKNAQAGDMVSGTYQDAPSSANGGSAPVWWNREDADYSRPPKELAQVGTDGKKELEFVPDPNPPSDTTAPGDAFLVRMRRSNEGRNGIVRQDQGVDPSRGLSSGPPIPYLFARGTTLDPGAKGAGITVRATSIADAKSALAVGQPLAPDTDQDFAGEPGVAPFGLSRSFWADTLTVGQATKLTWDSSGILTAPSSPGISSGQLLSVTQLGMSITRVGLRVADLATSAPVWSPATQPLARYVPIFDDVNHDNQQWIIGFGVVDSDIDTVNHTITVTKRNGIIAASNASAFPIREPDGPDDPPGYAEVLTKVLAANSLPRNFVLLSPALVRSE